ncbi:disease resistance protein RPM1-like [Ananas comosus]|uniref:Disease resistance protein RPM1-like n=1 Tax=Ananas comosus TaxID=4615 RepID=A0A6P5FRP2_ANACO|nr:disease resistance protein RPM1-like [Ananas comosus]
MDKRSLAEKREVPNNIDTMDYRSLVEEIRTYLQCKKYVLILDDVWSTDVLDNIKNALLNSNSKSRIVLTTRIRDVALLANENHMFELKPLQADDSWDLFCKNAFWKSANKICPPPLEQCAKRIVEKCGALPLAIVSIARLLSFREQTSSEWEKVYKDLEWYLTNNESKLHGKVHDILKLSLDDLPHYLQNCFLYCSSFPEDYTIESDRLIRLWVAEGFIEERERMMEEVAEDYLNELVHRCLLQVAEWNEVGRVYAYRMHDIIRVLARSESKELSFCMVCEHSRTILQGYKARRLSILSDITEYCTEDKSHLRSVLVFNNSMRNDLLKSVLRSSKFLRVLELQGAPIEKVPSEICNLFNLHYLDESEIGKLLKGITRLHKLGHLVLSEYVGQGIKAPVGIWRLKGLQTLGSIEATRKIVRNVEALTELRTFAITGRWHIFVLTITCDSEHHLGHELIAFVCSVLTRACSNSSSFSAGVGAGTSSGGDGGGGRERGGGNEIPMVEAVISSLVLKIGAALAIETTKSAASLLLTGMLAMKELMKDISDIKDELEIMQAFLRIAERLKEKDERVLLTAIKRYRNIKSWHHLSKKLKDIKIDLQKIMERRTRYDTRGMESEAKPRIVVGCSKSRAELAHFVKEDDIVGIDKYRDLLLGWLKDEDEQQQQPMIISVLGMGGLGKTTLVTHVYKIIKATFDACAWVAVSQSYETHDLLRQILKELCREGREKRKAPNNNDTLDYRSLVETIRTHLQCRKYLLILDDVWSTNVMDNIKDALLNSNCKSRIVLTTRIRDVALLANENRMFELKPLEADHSWDLFCKNTFWKSANKICPPPLEQCAKKIVEKCGGLPLAIVSIARLLSFREQTDSEWEKVYKDLEWYLTNNESKLHEKVHDILKLSLDDLPHYLRNCFLYCSSFPEDYRIASNKLIRLWMAEGFIEERERMMEEVAEDYLNELVHRCLLQVAERNEDGSIHACRMHDIIRVLALSKSKELSFCMVYEHSRTILQRSKARRLSVLSNITNYFTEDKSHLRSVLIFNYSMSYDLLKSVLRSSKFLRVLELDGALIEKLPSEICNLFNLHYLGLRATGIKELPKGITRLQKLRHLVSTLFWGIKAPVGIWRLKGLQTLGYIKATRRIVRNVEALTELRTFGITCVRTHHCADLWNSITKMNHLSFFSVKSEPGQELRQLDTLRLPLRIQSLYLQGKLDKTSVSELAASFRSLTNLTRLTLSEAKFDEDTFPYLQALPALMFLELCGAYDGMKLHFQATSFPKLKKLYISGAQKLSQVEIERGAMASLNTLKLRGCPELKELPHGIEYLTTLQDLNIWRPAEELVELLLGGGGGGEGDHSNDWRTRVRHIPNFTIWFERHGEFVTERIQ